ncbi:MAG: hypothetical protein JNL72_02990 [Flavipsychrobacter sp.]|nr:hypothetical protein [Flavipsychrobacter sp.]
MKQLLLALFTFSASVAAAQDVYVLGGFVTNTPTLRFNTNSNGLTGDVNGATRLNKISERGYAAGLGMMLKTKPTATFGARIETNFEHYTTTVDRTVTRQVVPFAPQETLTEVQGYPSNYLRLSASITYARVHVQKLNFQADLGYSQVLTINGWNTITPYSNVVVSGGLGYRGILLKAGSEIGLNNMLRGAGSYKGYAKRYFVGLNIYPRTLFARKKKEDKPGDTTDIYDRLDTKEPD